MAKWSRWRSRAAPTERAAASSTTTFKATAHYWDVGVTGAKTKPAARTRRAPAALVWKASTTRPAKIPTEQITKRSSPSSRPAIFTGSCGVTTRTALGLDKATTLQSALAARVAALCLTRLSRMVWKESGADTEAIRRERRKQRGNRKVQIEN